MAIPFVDASELLKALPLRDAVDALDKAFRTRMPEAPQRAHLDVGRGDLLLMPAWDRSGVGVKLVTVNPANQEAGLPLIHGLYVLFDENSLAPRALFDGAALTGLRTAAVSALATRYLADPQAEHLVLFGAGTQARWHLRSMLAVRDIRRVTVVSRTQPRAEALAKEAAAAGVRAGTGSPEAIADAHIVCTCTTSATPVFEGRLLRPGAHVNAVGAFKPTTREVDTDVVRAATVVVERRDVALAEAGDLLQAIDEGAFSPESIAADLSELARGRTVRRSVQDITLFKSVGMASEDLIVATAAVKGLQPGTAS